MNNTEILKQEAAHNKAFNAICTVFALRQRSRSTLTVQALRQRLREEGFNYAKPEFEHAIEVLSQAGVGEIVKSKFGRVLGLKNIKITLQSVGMAAYGKNGQTELLHVKKSKAVPMITETRLAKKTIIPNNTIDLLVYIGDRPVTLKLPDDITDQDMIRLVSKLRKV